jgi:hypothetical protein
MNRGIFGGRAEYKQIKQSPYVFLRIWTEWKCRVFGTNIVSYRYPVFLGCHLRTVIGLEAVSQLYQRPTCALMPIIRIRRYDE